MTKQLINRHLCAILTTAAEVAPGTTGESLYMLGCGVSLSDWQTLKGLMQQAGLATFAGHEVRLTAAGVELARKVEAFAKG